MLHFGHRLPERGWLLLWLLLAVLKAQSSGEVRPKPLPCQQSPTRVSCKGAGLHEFPKELGQGVQHLELSNNFIQNLSESRVPCNLTTLRRLDLSGNRMTRLPAGIFRSAPELGELNLSNNYIMVIEEGAFEALRDLRVLNLALNSLHCISSFTLTQLRVLNLSHNALELFDVEQEDEQHYLLQVLDLSHNHLLFFPELPHAHSLTHLNLSNNAIASLLPSSHHPAEFVLPYAGVARHDNNRSWSSMAHLTNVADLDLSNNHLHQFPFAFFHRLTSLHSLNVSMNCLQDVTKESLTGLFCSPLESLDIRSNNLVALEKPALASWSRSLQLVSVAGNPFDCCGLAWLDALQAAGVSVRDLSETLCSYQDKAKNLLVEITSSPRWLCPHPKGNSSLPVLVVVISLLFLSYGACCLLKKGPKLPGCLGCRSNRVDVVPCPPGKAAARPADSVTKV
ncbi:PREDICTED: negative regulator of reactive oxygen species-like [Tinamus guttatus]|uniref:negative regulator of reactive oxygen species-like n=1 Tax=Tinamus guttatus TaxID=94827 RepID=UPI00052EF4A1|nr:PREDICTED: negative regulator of reactive oxygen species-like [Tinamus guttatus]